MLEEATQGVPPHEKVEVVSVSIPDAEVEGDVVFYRVSVIGTFNSWEVKKRYSQFEELYNELVTLPGGPLLPKGCVMPPKKIKLFSSHLHGSFIEERRVLLENFLRKLAASKDVSKLPLFADFMTTDRCEARPDLPETAAAADIEGAEITDVSIPTTRLMSDHVLYQVDVCNEKKRKSFSKWTVLKRFGQFHDMDQAMRASFAGEPDFVATLPEPPSRKVKLLVDHMDPAFIEERRVLMESYLKKLVRIERVVKNDIFLQFMGVR